jgi:hypothetical protein
LAYQLSLKNFCFFSLLAAADLKSREASIFNCLSVSSIDYFSRPSFTELDSDCSGCSAGNNSRTFYSPAPFGAFTAHKMTAAAAMPPDFTGSGDLDSFAQPLVGFLFWHLICSLNIKAVIYNICICRSIPQPGNSQKNEKLIYPHRA